jgi:hypothetical protein
MSDIYRRSITFILWQCNVECERNIGEQLSCSICRGAFNAFLWLVAGLGAIEIYFGNYKVDQIYSGWYPLFPLYSLGLSDMLSP